MLIQSFLLNRIINGLLFRLQFKDFVLAVSFTPQREIPACNAWRDIQMCIADFIISAGIQADDPVYRLNRKYLSGMRVTG